MDGNSSHRKLACATAMEVKMNIHRQSSGASLSANNPFRTVDNKGISNQCQRYSE
jgi:hypothetical protein